MRNIGENRRFVNLPLEFATSSDNGPHRSRLLDCLVNLLNSGRRNEGTYYRFGILRITAAQCLRPLDEFGKKLAIYLALYDHFAGIHAYLTLVEKGTEHRRS